jgi:hypothetical protein
MKVYAYISTNLSTLSNGSYKKETELGTVRGGGDIPYGMSGDDKTFQTAAPI